MIGNLSALRDCLATQSLWDTITFHMERVPFFRRTLWISGLVLIAVGLPYALLFLRASPTGLPGSLLLLVPGLGALLALGALVLSSVLVVRVQDIRSSLSQLTLTLILAIWLLSHLAYLSEDQRYAIIRLILFDLDLLALASTFSLMIAAQFVLPVERGRDRLLAIRRLVGYTLGERGPVTFVEEGIARQAYAEDLRPGPGVFLIDNASAVVLRTDTAFTRAMGPGVVFSQPGERCAEALDLRPQIRVISGSKADDTDTSEADVTSEAVTQDGITISAEITITFILDPGLEGSPRLGRFADKPPYEFNRTSVERAVYAHTFGELGDVPWSRIPALLVADVWREEVKQWPLNKMLSTLADQNSPLEQICITIRERLLPPTRKGFEQSEPREEESSRELEILGARGIRLLDISIANLQIPAPIQEERSLRWRQAWGGEVQEALQEAMERVRLAREKGEKEAEQNLLEGYGHSLLEALRSNKQPGQRETLLALVTDMVQQTASNDAPGIAPQLRAKLVQLQGELQNLPADCQDISG